MLLICINMCLQHTYALAAAAAKGQVGKIVRRLVGDALAEVEARGVELIRALPVLGRPVQVPHADEDVRVLLHLLQNQDNRRLST